MKDWKTKIFKSIALMALGVFLIVLGKFTYSEESLGQSFLSNQSGLFTLNPLFEESTILGHGEEKVYGWEVKKENMVMGKLTMIQYALKNEDLYYYLRYLPEREDKSPLSLAIPISLEDFSYRYVTYPEGYDFAKSHWSEKMRGTKDTLLPKESLYIDDERGSYFLSYVDVFELQARGVKRERYNLAQALSIEEGKIFLHFPHRKNTSVEQWGIIGKEALIDWDHPTASEHLRVADFNRVRKQGQEGIYYFTPATYSPTSPTSFWFNPAYHIGEVFIRTEGARFFEDFGLVSLYQALRSQNKQGYWWSTPRSNWLFEDYGIDGSFYDTRFSTDAAIFLLKGYEKYKEDSFLEAARKYGEYLLQFAEDHHYKTENGGWLVMDYGHDLKPGVKTHVSLNHLLTEMNFLYHLYILTEEEAYIDLADRIRLAVKDTVDDWIKNNGDLWYAYQVDGTYGKMDYPVLTLKDLRISQRIIAQIEGAQDPDFERLIQSKEGYLIENNMSLW
ncbi:MAG: hypothetical protein AB2421_04630 [Thermotaleaceae bacterium]